MASSEVEICNLALSHIRGGGINSLTENSLQAQQCALLYPNMRDKALKAAPWSFNKRMEVLALRSDTVFGWVYLYQYPSDAIRLDRLIMNYSTVEAGDGTYRPRYIEDLFHPDLGRQIEHKIFNVAGQKVIAAQMPDLRIEYGHKTTDVTLFDIDFDIALAHLLASQLAVPIVGGETGRAYQKDQDTLYRAAIADAIALSLNESYSPPTESEFITVRS